MPHKHFIHAKPSGNKGEYVAEVKYGNRVVAKAYGSSRKQATKKALDKIPKEPRFEVETGSLPNTYSGRYYQVTDNKTGEVYLSSSDNREGIEQSSRDAMKAVESQMPIEYFREVKHEELDLSSLIPRGWVEYHPIRGFFLPLIIMVIIVLTIVLVTSIRF